MFTNGFVPMQKLMRIGGLFVSSAFIRMSGWPSAEKPTECSGNSLSPKRFAFISGVRTPSSQPAT